MPLVSATTLLFLRMTLSLPFFLAMAWWMRGGNPIARRDWLGIVGLGFLGYYLASLLDFLGLPRLGHPEFARHNARPRGSPVAPALREELAAHYAPYDERLAPWLGRPPSWRTP